MRIEDQLERIADDLFIGNKLQPGDHRVVWDAAESIRQMREAIDNFGPAPQAHMQTMRAHRREWPTIWAAIDRLIHRPSTGRVD